MSKFGIKGATWLGMAVALVAMALAIGPGAANATPVGGDSKNTMDVVPADSGLVPLGTTFDVDLNVSEAELAYTVAGAQLQWTDADIDYVSAVTPAPPDGIYGFPNAPAPGSGTPPLTEEVIISGLVTATPANTVGLMATVTLECVAASSDGDLNGDPDALPDTLLHLVTIVEDPLQGSATAASAGNPDAMVLEDGLVTCVQAADVTTAKVGAGLIEAGGTFDYVVTLTNLGPNAAAGVTLGDNLPETIPDDAAGLLQKIVADLDADTTPDDFAMTVNGTPTPCVPGYLASFTHPVTSEVILNIILCDLASVGYSLLQPNDVVVLTITVSVPLWDAGKLNVNTAQGGSLTTYDPDPSNEADCALIPGLTPANIGCDFTQVVPANVDIAKAGVPDPATAGDIITWTIDVDCLPTLGVPASSPCADATGTTGPVITDDVQDNQVGVLTAAFTAGTGSCVINHADASGTDKVLDPDVTCTVTAPMAPGTAVQVEITTQTAGPAVITAPTTCDNDAGVTYGDPVTLNAPASVVCNPAVCTVCLDKGSGVIPDPIAVLVGQSATVTVWEQIEVVDPGANPNLIHTWVASSASPHVSEAWVASGTGTLDFSTGPHATPGLFVISQDLEVTCNAPTAATAVDIDISAIGLVNDSPTSLEVACYDEPQEVKEPDNGNLWIMRHPNCLNPVTGEYDIGPCSDPGKGWLLIEEVASAIADVDSPNDADSDPEGLGAYEKQVKFDHKLIHIEVADAGFLGSTGRAVNCDLTIVTENWVLFGCVSVGTMNGPTDPGPVVLSTITVYPEADLVERIRPTKDNGVVTPILDENCEWADIYGDPMLGMVGGGLVPVCADATITIRMLEGDLNLDCNVDLLDEQAIAFRYGASFGLLLYDQWYDLEPKLTDFDIDIKDLQFVFGRDGSTCDNPIPDQPPSPPIP